MNPLLLPLAAAFRLGVTARCAAYRYRWLETHRLSRPVVSVGNLTLGGTGKTPLVAAIANILLKHGVTPSILTRGYGRTSKAETIVVAPGEARDRDPHEVGDEPALLARMLPSVPIVVCANRFRGGTVAEARFEVGAHILDDGFQHLALERNFDLVALDATQPISHWGVLPAGRQRESITALRRADAVVITRTECADPTPLEWQVITTHPAAKVFRGRTVLLNCMSAWSGESIPYEQYGEQKVAAFCALGNPQGFFLDLRRWGFKVVFEHAFPDHHVYTGDEIRSLAGRARERGAVAVLTTSKDAVKFSRGWTAALPVLVCNIETQISDASAFESTLLSSLEKSHR